MTETNISGNLGIGIGNFQCGFTGGANSPITNSTISGNQGTGISIGAYCGATITNSTISGNTSAGNGGGIYTGGFVALVHTTVSDNSAALRGGGLYNSNQANTHLVRSLISGNRAPQGPEAYSFYYALPSTFADDFNVFGHDSDAGVVGFTPGPTDIIPTGPLSTILATLANNGGPTQTHTLVAGSPAVDAVGAGCPPPVADQRGVMRPVDGDGDSDALCDIGAFELEANGGPPSCATATPTTGCTVNGVPNQICTGSGFNDTILGTAGDDVIVGLGGNDVLTGRGGADLCAGAQGW